MAVLVIERVRDYYMSDTTTMMTVIGEDVVVSFTGSAGQYTCTPHFKLPSGRHLSFPCINCSTSNIDLSVTTQLWQIKSVSIFLS